MRVLAAGILLISLAFAATSTADEHEDPLVAEFLSFAQQEWATILGSIKTGYENSVEMMGATKMPMSRKQMYVVAWIAGQPDEYQADIRRTDSLQHPYKGTITFIVPVERGTLVVKGPKAHCADKPLKECLAGGGKIASRGMFNPVGGKMTVAQPTEVVLTYVRKDDQWVRETTESLLDIVSTAPSVTSIPK